MTTLLVWWVCNYNTCIFHTATYADTKSCLEALKEQSICIQPKEMDNGT